MSVSQRGRFIKTRECLSVRNTLNVPQRGLELGDEGGSSICGRISTAFALAVSERVKKRVFVRDRKVCVTVIVMKAVAVCW